MDEAIPYILDPAIISKRTGQPPKIFSLQQFLVWKFLKEPNETNWAREIKIANKLIKRFPNVDYWNFVCPSFKIHSLAWFISRDGKKFLYEQVQKKALVDSGFFESKPTPVLLEKPIGEDKEIDKKPNNLVEFVNNCLK